MKGPRWTKLHFEGFDLFRKIYFIELTLSQGGGVMMGVWRKRGGLYAGNVGNYRGFGRNPIGGPIIIHTNPSQPDQYSGSVTATGSPTMLIQTGIHENAHQGQSIVDHTVDAVRELVTGGESSRAQDMTESIMRKNPSMLQDFNQLVDACRKCSKSDSIVK